MIFAPKIPIEFDAHYGFENVDNIRQLVHFHLKNLLFTFPGEKISDPLYGVGVKKILFESNELGYLNNVSDIIVQQITRYLGYLETNFVTVQPTDDDYVINITISYSLPNIIPSDKVSFEVSQY